MNAEINLVQQILDSLAHSAPAQAWVGLDSGDYSADPDLTYSFALADLAEISSHGIRELSSPLSDS